MSVCSEPRLRRLIVTINLSFKMETEYCWMLKWMLKSKHKIFKFWNMWWVVTSRGESWWVTSSHILPRGLCPLPLQGGVRSSSTAAVCRAEQIWVESDQQNQHLTCAVTAGDFFEPLANYHFQHWQFLHVGKHQSAFLLTAVLMRCPISSHTHSKAHVGGVPKVEGSGSQSGNGWWVKASQDYFMG